MDPIKNNLSSLIVSLPASFNLIGYLDLQTYMAPHKETKKALISAAKSGRNPALSILPCSSPKPKTAVLPSPFHY